MFQKTAKLFCFLYSHSAVLKKSIRIYSTLPYSANEYAWLVVISKYNAVFFEII